MSAELKYRADIDGLRAVAVLLVVVFHAFPGVLPSGFVGVDIFFVISGYLITKIIVTRLSAGTFSIVDFYVFRIRRIFPALALVLVSVLIAGWFLLSFDEYVQLGRHVSHSSAFVLNFRLLREAGYFDVASDLKPLLHLWSLSVEEQFYVIWPVAMVIAWRFRQARLMIVVALVLSFAVNIFMSIKNPTAAFFLPTTRFWELMSGALLAVSETRSVQREWFRWLPPLGLALIVVGLFLITPRSAFPGYLALLPVGGTIMIIAGGERAWFNRSVLSLRPIVFLGLVSYPLYLWHWPLLSIARIRSGESLSLIETLVLVTISIALAVATFLFVERPIRRMNFARFKWRMAAPLLVLLLGVGFVGLNLPASALGLSRFPPEMRKYLTYKFDRTEWREGKCFLRTRQNAADFAEGCVDPDDGSGKPIVLLWGDSHAGHLVPGLRALATKSGAFRFAEFAQASCPPVLARAPQMSANCIDVNRFVIGEIARLKPKVVVVAGFWANYEGDPERWQLSAAELSETIREIKRAGVEHVVVVGQVPTWRQSQPKIIVHLFMQNGSVPDFTDYRLNRRAHIDGLLKAPLTAAGALYLEPATYLCRDQGCLLHVGEEPAYFDHDHLTPESSKLLVEKMLGSLIAAK